MRVGDCSLEIVPVGGGSVRELPTGHVLARPGQVYLLRIRNLGPLRAVAEVRVDGRAVTAGGLVLDPRATVELERPIHATERGRFTVVAEGDEGVFGPDGGRDNPELGLIEVRFRRELPGSGGWDAHDPVVAAPRADPLRPEPRRPPFPRPGVTPPTGPRFPGEWFPPWLNSARPTASAADGGMGRYGGDEGGGGAYLAAPVPPEIARPVPGFRVPRAVPPSVERAAGTGLTGHSAQEFRAVRVGELEAEATVLRLRLVIGSPEAIEAPRPLPDEDAEAPARPAARP